jgi:hypothetical protein
MCGALSPMKGTRRVILRSEELQEGLGRYADVLDDLAQQVGRKYPGRDETGRCDAAVGVTKLFVRSTLSNFHKSKLPKNPDDLSRLEMGSLGKSTYFDELSARKFGFDLRLAVFKE